MLTAFPVALGIMDPLNTLFGWAIQFLYSIIPSYGADIIIFTVFLRLIIIPLSLKNHKNTLKQMQLTDEMNELKRYYGDDKQGYSMAQMELMKKHKISMMGGCLPSLLSILFIWPIWRIISQPMHYIMGVSTENIKNIAGLLHIDAAAAAGQDIPLLHALKGSGAAMTQAVSNGWIRADQLMNLDFLGMNLGLKPTISPQLLFHDQMETYLPLLIIPLIAVITSFLVSKISEWTTPTQIQAKLSKELAKKNPARDVVADQSQTMMKSMAFIMPLVTLFTVFTMPAAIGLYWIIGNLMGMFQSYLLYFLYTKPVLKQLRKENTIEILEPQT